MGKSGDAAVLAVPFALLAGASLAGWIDWVAAAAIAVAIFIGVRPLRHRSWAFVDRIWLDGIRSSASVVAVDNERSRVASDIHDAPLQEIASVIARLERVPAVDEERHSLRVASDQLRDLITGLHPPMLEPFGLAACVEHLASQARHDPTAPAVDVKVRSGLGRPPLPVEVAAYRIVEEAFRNALRHARATRIVITGEVEGGCLVVHVEDDGIGSAQAVPRGGLTSMPARARAVGGRFIRFVAPTGGTVVGFEWRPT